MLQRACGLKFTTQPSLLRSFVACAEAAGDTYVRADRVLDWAVRTPSAAQARNRLAIARRFAMALAIEDPGHEVLPADAFGRWRFERRMPHIYTADEIAALMAAARRLGRPGSIRPDTMVTLIGLLAATGLRVSEALKLDVGDITADGLVIRETKFRKSRLVPLHSSARAALDRYLRRRRKMPGKGTSFFAGDSGRPAPLGVPARAPAARARRLAEAALRQIGALYAVEARVRGAPPEVRLAARREYSAPVVAALKPWLEKQLSMISSGFRLATDIR